MNGTLPIKGGKHNHPQKKVNYIIDSGGIGHV